MRGVVVGLLVATAFILSGCQYLMGAMMGGPIGLPGGSFDPGAFGSFDPGDFGSFDPGAFGSFPPADAIYKTGSATVKIDGTSSTYGTLAGPASLMADLGANAMWTDGHGHYLLVAGAKSGNPLIDGGSDFVQVEQIVDDHHWMTGDPSDCKVDVTTADKTGFSGTASCKGLRWSDAIAPFDASGNPAFVAGQAPFDLEVTFQAKP
jgi:hypothetical protein